MSVWLDGVPDLECPDELYALLRCDRCGLIATDPYPSDAAIAGFYEGGSSDQEYPEAGPVGALKDRLAMRSMANIARKANVRSRRILDYGTGAGRYAAAVARAFPSADVIGTDFNAAAAPGTYFDAAPANLRYVPYAEVERSDDLFDLILARHVLEHTSDPISKIREWSRMLAPRGALYIEVPNAASATATLLRKRWPLLYVPKHLSHFTRETLAAAIVSAGGHGTIGRCEMPMMGNVLALATGHCRFDPRFRIPGIALHPVQLAIEALARQGTCLYALVRCQEMPAYPPKGHAPTTAAPEQLLSAVPNSTSVA